MAKAPPPTRVLTRHCTGDGSPVPVRRSLTPPQRDGTRVIKGSKRRKANGSSGSKGSLKASRSRSSAGARPGSRSHPIPEEPAPSCAPDFAQYLMEALRPLVMAQAHGCALWRGVPDLPSGAPSEATPTPPGSGHSTPSVTGFGCGSRSSSSSSRSNCCSQQATPSASSAS